MLVISTFTPTYRWRFAFLAFNRFTSATKDNEDSENHTVVGEMEAVTGADEEDSAQTKEAVSGLLDVRKHDTEQKQYANTAKN